jgi:hypothetical protein
MTIHEFFVGHWDMLLARGTGSLTLRLILQPTVASLFAIRSGLRDAREGRTPYGQAVLTKPGERRELFRNKWQDVGKVFIVALLLDMVYQLISFRWIYPGQTLIVAILLAIIPYLLVRGSTTRIARRFRRSGA